MHALAAGRIVGEVMKRVREGDCPTTPKFSNETLEDALLEVHHLFQREQEERERLTAAHAQLARELAEAREENERIQLVRRTAPGIF